MLQRNTSDTPKNGEKLQLPQDIIDACRKISDRARKKADPTKISHISIPADLKSFSLEKSGHPIERLISLISRNTLNVCELLEDENGEIKSIELPLENVQKKLSITEITAEIILQHVVFHGGYMDRSFMIGRDRIHGKEGWFNAPINMRYSENSYAIFDLENDDNTFPTYCSEQACLDQIWKSVLCLYDRDLDKKAVESDYRLFLELGRVDAHFGKHIVKKSQELLNIYDCPDGKKIFLEQCKKAKKDNCTELYSKLITNLRLIHSIFSKNNEALEDYISFDFKLAINDIYTHFRAIGRISRYLIKRR